ncbi:discoidin domain-containing protein [Clostridium drakei]|uniref:F5/8 type C domain-containing protein n=1 Tax=Clostridium drakei TaxID=332101 RepID=A0A2U8DN58_9CLOT|nr:discoidin domain-containing protein [Clostridium drakei]AWI04150.1 hypothetical protein B9W14_06450 [Clostridium drakei]
MYKDITPYMTGYTTPTPYRVFASNISPRQDVAYRVFGAGSWEPYCGEPSWICLVFDSPKQVTRVGISTYYANACCPVDFKIYGSDDTTNGSDGTWTKLASYTGQYSWYGQSQLNYFDFSNSKGYKAYKIDATRVSNQLWYWKIKFFEGGLLNPVNSLFDLKNLGDCIPCRYTALTAGQVGTFSELGTCTAAEIPVTGTATPDGKFYLIMVGYDSQGRKKFIADRNIQTGISWDNLNNAGFIEGNLNSGYKIPTLTADNSNEVVLSCLSWQTGYEAFRAFDNDPTTSYASGRSNAIDGEFITINLGSPKIIDYMSMYFNIPTGGGIRYAPRSFDILASVDGVIWKNLASYSNEINWTLGETRTYHFINTQAYKYYKILFHANNGANVLIINSIQLYSSEFSDKLVRCLTGGISSTDKDNEWDKILVESNLGGTITPGDNNIWHWSGAYSLTSTTPINGIIVGGSTSNNTHRVLRGNSMVDFFSFVATNDTRLSYGNFRPVMLVEDTSASVVTVTKFMLQQGTNIFDINPANYSTPPTKIAELHVVESLTDATIEQSGGGWDDVVNYLSLFKGTKYKTLKFVRNE